MTKTTVLKIFAWSLSVVVVIITLTAWSQGLRWQFSDVSSYKLFPFFGLVAFSLMWSHYIVSAVRQYLGINKQKLRAYIETTSFLVLLALFLHPGLLVWQLWRDGFGLPPESYLQDYVASSLRWAAVLGSVSLFMFLAYEFRRWFSDRSWWKYINYATDVAMVAIFIHSINLGTQLQRGWFRAVWYFYGLTLLASLGYIYYLRFKKHET